MKNLLFLCIALFLSQYAKAQNNEPEGDGDSWSADVRVVVDEFFKPRKDEFRRKRSVSLDAPFIDLGFNRVRNSEGFPNVNTKSVNFAAYPLVGSIYLHNRVDIITGIGFEWFNYRFANGMTIFEDDDGITKKEQAWKVFKIDENTHIKKSKLTSSYINIPILIKWYLPTSRKVKRSIYVMAGPIFGFNLGSHTKIKYEDDNGTHKSKIKERFNLSVARYGFTARMYYRNFGIYTNYYLSPLFEKDKGIKAYPFTVGISLNIQG